MVRVKIQTSTQEELAKVAEALKALGIIQRGTIKGDGFAYSAKFATDTKNDEKTKG